MIQKSDYIIVILFALALLSAYSIYQPFLLSMVVALLLTMATANVHQKFTQHINSESISSAILTMLLFIILFVPIIYFTTVGVQSIAKIDADIITKTTIKTNYAVEGIPLLEELVEEYINNDKILESIKTSTAFVTKAGTSFKDSIVLHKSSVVAYHSNFINLGDVKRVGSSVLISKVSKFNISIALATESAK